MAQTLARNNDFTDEQKRGDFDAFAPMAARGMYSFACRSDAPRGVGYYLVAVPSVPIHIDNLSASIAQVVRRTVLRVDLSKVFAIEKGDIASS
ncbi:MAG: hypothetical protein HYS13_07575 [Planctomycetia bacterium]|nr:hypothetical protein [Planctomycetia bacterium]